MSKPARRIEPPAFKLAWLLWGAVVALSLLAAYVHLLTSAIERGETLRRVQARGGFIATANAATTLADSSAATASTSAPIPQSHVAFIVVP